MGTMAGQTYYRYIDSDGAAHYVDSAAEIPKAHKGAVHELSIAHDGSAKANTYVSDMLAAMHWPSFAIGCAVAIVVTTILRFVFSKKVMFAGVAAALAAGSFGSAAILPKLTSIPSSLTAYIPSTARIRDLPTPAEARRILDSLPKASADRDKALEAVFASETK